MDNVNLFLKALVNAGRDVAGLLRVDSTKSRDPILRTEFVCSGEDELDASYKNVIVYLIFLDNVPQYKG